MGVKHGNELGDDKAVDVFHKKCLRRILQIQWQEYASTEEPLERADMKPLSKVVKQRKRETIGRILIQDQNSDGNPAMTWAPD